MRLEKYGDGVGHFKDGTNGIVPVTGAEGERTEVKIGYLLQSATSVNQNFELCKTYNAFKPP